MRSIQQALQEHELIILRVIGEWWDLDLTGANKAKSMHQLVNAFNHLDLEEEIMFLPEEEQAAIQALLAAGGRMPVAQFSRQFGEIRDMGPAALERDEPWFTPVSSAEDLWYRGFLFRGFDAAGSGDMAEFFYLPFEFLEKMGVSPATVDAPAAPTEEGEPVESKPTLPTPLPAAKSQKSAPTLKLKRDPIFHPPDRDPGFQAVDDATTLLTLAQNGLVTTTEYSLFTDYLQDQNPMRIGFLLQLMEECSLLRLVEKSRFRPTRSAVDWLHSDREEALGVLIDTWRHSDWNELRHVPTLICEGASWYNDPITARSVLIDNLVREAGWFSIAGIVHQVYTNDPDFQRPNGNYDTWYIRDASSGVYLDGFDSWHDVEGRLIPFLLNHPMRWLGLAQTAEDGFRLTSRGLAWLDNAPIEGQTGSQPTPMTLSADGLLTLSPDHDRYQRFQAGRIALILPATAAPFYTYRLTPSMLNKAKAQGISHERITAFITEATGQPIPASLKRAFERWDQNGIEARIEKRLILRVADGEILQKLRDHPKTRPFIGESFGDLAAAVQADEWEALFSAAVQLGIFLNTPE